MSICFFFAFIFCLFGCYFILRRTKLLECHFVHLYIRDQTAAKKDLQSHLRNGGRGFPKTIQPVAALDWECIGKYCDGLVTSFCAAANLEVIQKFSTKCTQLSYTAKLCKKAQFRRITLFGQIILGEFLKEAVFSLCTSL